jgi:hypothetical protein
MGGLVPLEIGETFDLPGAAVAGFFFSRGNIFLLDGFFRLVGCVASDKFGLLLLLLFVEKRQVSSTGVMGVVFVSGWALFFSEDARMPA